MTDQIFSFKDFITVVVFIITIAGFWFKLRKITQNDFGGFIKRKEFKELTETVNRIDKTVARLDERSKDQGKDIDSLFKWKNSK